MIHVTLTIQKDVVACLLWLGSGFFLLIWSNLKTSKKKSLSSIWCINCNLTFGFHSFQCWWTDWLFVLSIELKSSWTITARPSLEMSWNWTNDFGWTIANCYCLDEFRSVCRIFHLTYRSASLWLNKLFLFGPYKNLLLQLDHKR